MAYYTKFFFFSHLPKCGGGSLQQAFEDAGRDLNGKVVSRHDTPLENIKVSPPYHFFVVRNPWDYYVAQYEYARSQRNYGYVWEAANFSFYDFCIFLTEIPVKSFYPTPSVGYQSKYFLNFSYEVSTLKSLSLGNLPPSAIKVFKLEDGLEDIIDKLNARFSLSLKLPSQKINSSIRRPYEEYYNEECKELIRKKEEIIINKFNYSF